MTLEIDPNTEKGQIQLEIIEWCQEQMNSVLAQFFNGKYRIQKGLKIEFKIPLNGQFNESIKVDVSELAPESEERFKEAINEAKSVMAFRKPDIKIKDIKPMKVLPPNATDFPIEKKGDKDGTDKK